MRRALLLLAIALTGCQPAVAQLADVAAVQRPVQAEEQQPAPLPPPPPPDPCADVLALHEGRGAPDRQHWFNHLTYQDYARYWIACVHGWGEGEWRCLVALWDHESGWSPTIWNRAGSGAYGIPQSLPGTKMASHGDDWRTNGRTQVRWGSRYIDDRYGAPSKINGGRCRGPY